MKTYGSRFKLRPEIGNGMYWLHLLLITGIITVIFWIYSIMGYTMNTTSAFFLLLGSLAFADITVHTALKLD